MEALCGGPGPLTPYELLPGMVQSDLCLAHHLPLVCATLILLLLGLSGQVFEASFSLTGLTFEAVTSLRTGSLS